VNAAKGGDGAGQTAHSTGGKEEQWHITLVAACAAQCDTRYMRSLSGSCFATASTARSIPEQPSYLAGSPIRSRLDQRHMSTFTMPGGQSGEAMHRRFCTKCGSPILIEKDGTGRKLIMAGTLDDKSQFKPTISLFCEQAPSWVVMPTQTENLPRYYD
jgi:hypothetical protein